MKSLLALVFCTSLFFVQAVPAEEVEEVVIPTEISEPPYEIGNLISEQGHYIAQPDGSKINFRIVDNQIRIYWLDENGLVMEPVAQAASVRFTGAVRGRNFHRAVPLPDNVGLGAPGFVSPPHTFNVVIAVEAPEDAEGEDYASYAFRYVPSMDQAKTASEVKSTVAESEY